LKESDERAAKMEARFNELVRRLSARDMPPEEISAITGLSRGEIRKILGG
jgi:hypothetical protein